MAGRFDNRVDKNQAEIVARLSYHGAAVHLMQSAKGGFPDLFVWYVGFLILIEVKAEKGKLTKAQREWHARFNGAAHIVRSVEDVDRLIAAYDSIAAYLPAGPIPVLVENLLKG